MTSKLFIKFLCNIGLFVLFILIFFSYRKEVMYVIRDIEFLKWEIESANEKIEYIKREIKRTITEDTIATQIIFSSNKEDFILLFDFIDDEYDLKTYNFDVKEPQKVNIYENQQFYNIIKTEISASFETDSQIKLYAFLEEIISKIPGYVHIKTLDFIKDGRKIHGFFTLRVYTLKLKN